MRMTSSGSRTLTAEQVIDCCAFGLLGQAYLQPPLPLTDYATQCKERRQAASRLMC